MQRTAFIGHREVLRRGVFEALLREIERRIGLGCKFFTMGMHGEFDRLALSACRLLRKKYPEIEIEVVITSLNAGKGERASEFADVKTVMFEVEEVHYKRRITVSNQRMIDGCDELICYVDVAACRSGAKSALRYAEKRGVKIVNLF